MSYNQLGETCPDLIKINNKIEHLKDKKVTTKNRNPKPNILLREKLAKLRLGNQEKRDKIKSLKPKQDKIKLDIFIKNTLKKYNKPKTKKKKITDLIKFPEIYLI